MKGNHGELLTSANQLEYGRLSLKVNDVDVEIATASRGGELAPIVFVHGFGSTKEDYVDMSLHSTLSRHAFFAFDTPGCGESTCSDLPKVDISFLVATTLAVLRQVGIEKFHLVGHSMGGLTALVLADTYPDRILIFIDIKGNLAPEDCFLSRQIFQYPSGDVHVFFNDFIERTRRSASFSSAIYAATLRHKVQPGVVRGIFESMVELSDNGDLLTKYLALPCPKMFMYGHENRTLSYLPRLGANGVELAEIEHSGHFPMYSNPVEMWRRISDFLGRLDLAS
ncbi:alpha beta hydrolase protein [Phlyctema vagabunda]|uniref:Alpha beta hydrolase protein n=1 Tax=Phlyctema vagabunda TaxID=108571 RepID=A0ABR4PIZ5_9HELO